MPATNAMNVSLTPELESFARSLVQSGRYNSASEVMRESLRLLQHREAKIRTLRDLIQEGAESGSAGTYDSEDIRQGLRARVAELRGEVERGERLDPRANPDCTL
jgi:antitoxin ParD1/3/4